MIARRFAAVVVSAGLLAIGACMGGGDDSEYPVSPGGTTASLGGTQSGTGSPTDPGENFPDATPGTDDGGTLGPDASGTIRDGGGLPFDSGAQDASGPLPDGGSLGDGGL